MDSKLSIDCIMQLIDQLRFDDEMLLYSRLIKDKVHFYKVVFDCRSAGRREFNTYARSETEAMNKILPLINRSRIKPYIVDTTESHHFHPNSFYCHVCIKDLHYTKIVNHSHQEIEYDTEYIDQYIRNNTDIHKIHFVNTN